jgi:hypothetical protein
VQHAGCPADLPLSVDPNEPKVSAVRMIYLRGAQIAAALGALSPDGARLDPRSFEIGDGAFDSVVELDHVARAEMTTSAVRRAALVAKCPVAGRRRRTARTTGNAGAPEAKAAERSPDVDPSRSATAPVAPSVPTAKRDLSPGL